MKMHCLTHSGPDMHLFVHRHADSPLKQKSATSHDKATEGMLPVWDSSWVHSRWLLLVGDT
jgi:hypothetical protein